MVMNRFLFGCHAEQNAVLRAVVPVGISNEMALFDSLAYSLNFPNYFGNNWDALEECMRDLNWLPEGTILLVHDDVPLSQDQASLSLYLSILSGACDKFAKVGKRKLVVAFP